MLIPKLDGFIKAIFTLSFPIKLNFLDSDRDL